MNRLITTVPFALALLSSCVWDRAQIRPMGRSPKELQFRISQEADTAIPVRSLIALTVTWHPCGQPVESGGSVVWALRAIDGVGAKPAPFTIAYSKAPPGYTSEKGPLRLEDGCYEVYMLGANVRGFGAFAIHGDSVLDPPVARTKG